MTRPGGSWVDASKFSSARERNRSVLAELQASFEEAIAGQNLSAGHQSTSSVVTALVAPLEATEPQPSAAAELAYLLCAYCIVEMRVLGLEIGSPDLKGARLAGDRAASEGLSKVLLAQHVPSTKGALQNSTYRGGYRAEQARNPGLTTFLDWMGGRGRSLDDVRGVYAELASVFAAHSASYPELPPLDPNVLTFARMKTLIGLLRAKESEGAYEQYLVAALLHQEFQLLHPVWRAETKPVHASDAATGAVADVQVRHGMQLVQALEVSANEWRTKIPQAVAASGAKGTVHVTVVAPARDLGGADLEEVLVDAGDERSDVAVVDIDVFMDVISSRLTVAAE